MRTRNIVVALAASVAFAGVAAAQQPTPAKPAQHKAAAAPTKAAASKADMKVSADSAKAIVMANVPGAAVKSEHLRRAGGRRVYVFRLSDPKSKDSLSATVDAETGAYTKVVPSKPRTDKTGAKKS